MMIVCWPLFFIGLMMKEEYMALRGLRNANCVDVPDGTR